MRDVLNIHHPGLALLGLVLITVVCYHGLDLAVRIAASQLRAHRLLWFIVGAPLAGLGLWAADFVTLLSWLQQPMSHFNPLWSLGACGASVFCCVGILWLSDVARLQRPAVLLGAVALCALTVAMHYLNLASVHIDIFRDLGLRRLALTTGCVVAGLILCVSAIRLSRHPRREHWFLRRVFTAVLMGLGAHAAFQVSLAAAIVPLHLPPMVDAASSLVWLGATAGVGALALELTNLVLSHQCTRLYLRAQRLSGSVSQLNSQITHLATHDALTGLPNRSTIVQWAEQALRRVRLEHRNLAVFYIDLDGFKAVNDTYNHASGDELLRQVARRLERLLPAESLARVGGDEFIAVVSSAAHAAPTRAPLLARTLITAMQQDFLVSETPLQVTISIGLAFYPHDGDQIEDLIANADASMYEAKARGRNGFRMHDAAMKSRALRLLQIQRGLQTATEDGSLCLHYQPKHDAITGTILGAEALARWTHPQLGNVPPDEFIGVAERSGQIVRLGDWFIGEACRQLKQWRQAGLPTLRIAINLSPLQLNQGDLVDRATELVSAAGLDPSQIMFEVTESMAMQDAERTTALLRNFRARGFEFAIDDFGTGYSSLAYLQKLQVRQLKIDRLFVSALDSGGHEARAIITAIIALAHTLEMEVVAEGVETQSQAQTLRALGCDQIQGYLMSRPMLPREFERACLAGVLAHSH